MNKFLMLIVGTLLTLNVQAMSKEKKKISDKEKSEVLTALQANEALHASFFEYKGAEVEKNAKALSNALSKISNKEIKKLLTFSKTKLSEIKKDADREANNKAYNTVSMALIHVMNSYDLGGKYKSYTCPMVQKKWVQNTDKMVKVHNPYAPEMPHCGRQDKGQ